MHHSALLSLIGAYEPVCDCCTILLKTAHSYPFLFFPLFFPVPLFFIKKFPDDIDTDEIKESALEEYLAADGAEPGAGSTATLAIKRGTCALRQKHVQSGARCR